MPATTLAALLADATLQVAVVGVVAAIVLIGLIVLLIGRSGARDGRTFSAPPPPSAARRDGASAKSARPPAPSPQPQAPASPGYGAAPIPQAPPAADSARSFPYPPASPYPQASQAPAYAPPMPAAPPPPAVPQASPESSGAQWAVPAAPSAAPEPSRSEAAPVEPAAPVPFAPSAGSASSDIDWDAMEREQTTADADDRADDAAPARPELHAMAPSDDWADDGAPWVERGGNSGALAGYPAALADAPTAEELAGIEPAAGGDDAANDAEEERMRGITLGGDQQQAEAPAASAPSVASLQFTSFYPREVPTQQWQTLLVYTHIADALDAVRRDALKFAEELGERPRVMHAAAAQPVARGTTLTIVPRCAGVRFNPERLAISWDEDWQRSSFRFSADESLAGSAAAGEIAIYVGPLILAILKFGLLVSDASQTEMALSAAQQQTVGPSSVFASYSHDDTPVVLACRNAYKALGLTVNIDVDALRSGDQWDPRLMQLIDGSDVFQLFWSARAANSEAVQREWRYALAHSRGAGYIRPVYWEQPLIAPPAELSNVHFAYIDLPRE